MSGAEENNGGGAAAAAVNPLAARAVADALSDFAPFSLRRKGGKGYKGKGERGQGRLDEFDAEDEMDSMDDEDQAEEDSMHDEDAAQGDNNLAHSSQKRVLPSTTGGNNRSKSSRLRPRKSTNKRKKLQPRRLPPKISILCSNKHIKK